MEAEERDKLTAAANTLRQDLKEWERLFADTSDGRKASREDIKQVPEIALKYKEYNRLRDVLTGKKCAADVVLAKNQRSKKRKHEVPPTQTPSKHRQISHTPSKNPTHPAIADPYDSPNTIRTLFTPSRHSRVIGPTPQKDGQILGLFDLLSEEDTPEKKRNTGMLLESAIQATPSKPRTTNLDFSGNIKHSRTPQSSGKRFMLDSFATPLKHRDDNAQVGRTPVSTTKLSFATPSFLRRDSQRISMPTVTETEEGPPSSPEMVRLPRKPLVRGLSNMLANLRKMEEDAADDDLDALREMESGGQPMPKKSLAADDIVVEDSQAQLPLGGFDDEAMFDSEPEELGKSALGPDGQPWKIHKKKGQKRTTRRTNMKPVFTKPARSLDPPPDLDEDIEFTEHVIEDTQPKDDEAFPNEARNFETDSSGSEYTASEGGTRYRRPKQREKKKDGAVLGRVKKVGALAHANFKRLKLRNSGAKGGPAHNSRFRRKR